MKFKKNIHIAKWLTIQKINKIIKNYPSQYPTPKYLIFAKTMYHNGWKIKLYVANKVSKYLFIIKGDEVYKIRFSNYEPLLNKEVENDCDFYVGVSHLQVSTTEEIINKIIKEKVCTS